MDRSPFHRDGGAFGLLRGHKWWVAMHTCVLGQNSSFKVGVTLLLEDSEFTVSADVDPHAEVSRTYGPFRRDHMILLVESFDDRSELSSQIQSLKARAHPPWIVVLARTLDRVDMAKCFAAGVDGYLLQAISPPALIKSLKLVALGVKVFPSQIVTLMMARPSKSRNVDEAKLPHREALSVREHEVVNWLMLGTPNKIIAWKMSITDATVKVHVKNILKKVGLNSRTQLAVWAMRDEHCQRV